jgi:hypothetical protein
MGKENPLPLSGRWWEEEVFGVSANEALLKYPAYRDFDESMQEIMWTPLERLGPDGKPDIYDPMNPTWGMSGQMYFEVKRHLPRRTGGGRSGSLFLHIACRTKFTSLDFWHGRDAFFFWEGVYVTIDVSLLPKVRTKADFLVSPTEMQTERLNSLGNEIAQLLKERRKNERQKKLRKKCL